MGENTINNNGYDYVDLGLPSGTFWAAKNVGAGKPSDAGFYFQWGDTIGYTVDQIGKDKQFSWADYKFSINGSDADFSKYTNSGEILELEDDAAHVHMGGDWSMPSPNQIQELRDNTAVEWTTLNGVNGYLFTSNKDSSKFIFFPAVGSAWNGLIHHSGDSGDVWSNMLNMGSINGSQYLDFDSIGTYISFNHYRYDGLSVRGVIG